MAIDELDSVINGYLAKYPETEHIRRAIRVRMFFERGFSITSIAYQCILEEREVYGILRNRRTQELDRHLLNIHSIINGGTSNETADARFTSSVIQYTIDHFGIKDITIRTRKREYVDARTVVSKVLIAHGYGHKEIAFWIGVDRSDVYHMMKKDVTRIPTLRNALNCCISYAEKKKEEIMK